MLLAFTTINVFCLGLLAACQDGRADEGLVFPKCAKCPSRESLSSPGIGFALEIGYGYVLSDSFFH